MSLVAALLVALGLQAHGGGLDSLGCHHNRKAGGYHCHRGVLAGRSFSSKADALKALSPSKPKEEKTDLPTQLHKGPPGSSILPNASLVTARVLKYSIWDPVLLNPNSSQTFYSLVLDVCGSEKAGEEASLVQEGKQIEVFSRGPLSSELFGKTIQGTVRVRGDEQGQRYWIRGIRVEGECQ